MGAEVRERERMGTDEAERERKQGDQSRGSGKELGGGEDGGVRGKGDKV